MCFSIAKTFPLTNPEAYHKRKEEVLTNKFNHTTKCLCKFYDGSYEDGGELVLSVDHANIADMCRFAKDVLRNEPDGMLWKFWAICDEVNPVIVAGVVSKDEDRLYSVETILRDLDLSVRKITLE